MIKLERNEVISMKRFFYHYICLIFAIGQLVIFVESMRTSISSCMDDLEEYGAVEGQTIFRIIAIVILLFLIAIVDKLLRKVKCCNFIIDCILLILVTPFRFIFELITLINLHIESLKDNHEFGKRGTEGFYYLLFNTSNYYTRTYSKPVKKGSNTATNKLKNKKPRLSKAEKYAQQKQYIQEVFARKDAEIEESENFLRANRRSDGRFNVFIVPLCSIDNDKLVTFSVQNNRFTGNRYIDELYIDGKKIMHDMKYDNTLALSLRPGTYDFKIHLCGVTKSNKTYDKSDTKIDKTMRLDNVVVGNDNVYLGVFLVYGSVITQYVNTITNEVAKEKFDYFKKAHRFAQIPLNVLNSFCNYWEASMLKVDTVLTQYKFQKIYSENKNN